MGVVLYFSGDIAIDDIKRATAEYECDMRFDDLMYVIADYSLISSCRTKPPDIEEVWVMDRGAKQSNHRIRKAVVTTNPDVIKLVAHYRGILGPAFPVEAFATQAEARVWLGA
jgi:hypothetical protein